VSASRRPFSGGRWLDPTPLNGNLVADGDSLTAGSGGGETAWPTLIATSLPLATISNFAAIGDSVGVPGGNMLADGSLEVDPAYNSSKPWNVCVLWGGINDLAMGRTAAQLHADIKTWTTDRRSAHPSWKIIVCNISWTTTLGSQTPIDTINSSLAGDKGAANALVDVRGALGTSSSNPSFWQGDDLHLTTAGEQVVANAIYTAIRAVI